MHKSYLRTHADSRNLSGCVILPGPAHLARDVGPSLTTDLPLCPNPQRPRLSNMSAQRRDTLLDTAGNLSKVERIITLLGEYYRLRSLALRATMLTPCTQVKHHLRQLHVWLPETPGFVAICALAGAHDGRLLEVRVRYRFCSRSQLTLSFPSTFVEVYAR